MSDGIPTPVVNECEDVDEVSARVGEESEVGEPAVAIPQADQQQTQDDGAPQERHKDSIFEKFENLCRRRQRVQEASTSEKLSLLADEACVRPPTQEFTEADSSERVSGTRFLWENDQDSVTEGTNVWEHQESLPMNFEWERELRNTSIVAGVEDWVKSLDVPDVPDNRVKIIYASISAERKKSELCDQIQESMLQTDTGLCPLVIQMKLNKTLGGLRLLKYSVETIEDVLILLSGTSLDPSQRACLVEKLAATIDGDSMRELMQLSYTRDLLLISLGVLLDSDQRAIALGVLRTLISYTVRHDGTSRSTAKTSLFAKILKRCTAAESSSIKEELLASPLKEKGGPASEFHASLVRLLRKEL